MRGRQARALDRALSLARQVDHAAHKALVRFVTPSSVQRALSSPLPVCGVRFIRLFRAKAVQEALLDTAARPIEEEAEAKMRQEAEEAARAAEERLKKQEEERKRAAESGEGAEAEVNVQSLTLPVRRAERGGGREHGRLAGWFWSGL